MAMQFEIVWFSIMIDIWIDIIAKDIFYYISFLVFYLFYLIPKTTPKGHDRYR